MDQDEAVPPGLWPHHERAIANLRNAYQDDPEAVALIIGGSLAKGWGREDSDLDFLLVIEDEAFARASAEENLAILRFDLTDYPGGYVDGKKVTRSFLREVAERGSEPARSAFLGAWVEWSRDPEVLPLVQCIPIYPEEGHEDRLRSFLAQVRIMSWFVGEALKRDDPYLLAHATTNLALFAMRIVLAENRRIYPYHKWVRRAVSECPRQPEGFLETVDRLLRERQPDDAKRVAEMMEAFRAWDVPWTASIQRFLEDSEWNWREHLAPVADR